MPDTFAVTPDPGPATPDHIPRSTLTRVPDGTQLARVSTPRAGPPLYSLHSAPDDTLLCTIAHVQDAYRDVYDVLAPDATPLARVMHRPRRLLPWPRRTRWTVLLPTSPTLTGRRGTAYAWCLYVLAFPLILLYALIALALAFLFDDLPDLDLDLKPPEQTRWRAPHSRPALAFRGIKAVYHHRPEHLDTRVAYALAVLHDRHRTG
ncbi:hypothetical protein [Streptomyces acidiscabies]|uniref:Uncharacterized protein n=1 Tax=Streptomyces acidiscabies TaxID=42234 RepID=A0AAP6EG54_9ACTN|nr:hypothetical protein [Streptomyces acidiscabies]MBP5937564.1 hypothetical protein [Streptomyces sp. LBUM 1476]MBZ3914346.1 hypothetical protein [Streptomyces acidiscabies]MDX2960980.1 hypothetical protein [Streptomyces acidiscabies]MDX3017037.1 hypothetical protein [Streptomyces acidiscabies]MDX3788988.1 hypothetical protein [Streptomyces acidiscabies]